MFKLLHSVSAAILCDFYKFSHRDQYPDKTEIVSATITARMSRIKGINHTVALAMQAFCQNWLIDFFNTQFFGRPCETVIAEYVRFIKNTLGDANPYTKHLEDLHKLGHLPLLIRGVPEGTLVPIRVPMFTVVNTDERFPWLTNYVETMLSAEIWQPITNATMAFRFRQLLNQAAKDTGGDLAFVPFQGHDFSMRGMPGILAGMSSGFAHLTSFVGTDTSPAIALAEFNYGADITKGLVGTSVPATEHSVMCANGSTTTADEIRTLKRLITEKYPTGIISVVLDTRDFWNAVLNVVGSLKTEIMARDGKLVIRPDSGDPVKIVIGDSNAKTPPEQKGLISLLWEMFGGTQTKMGYGVLDSHIGSIYGDAITYPRAEAICAGLKTKKLASTNLVYGIGSYTYQHNTRDTFGMAMKTTFCKVNGDQRQLFKAPATDDGTKTSQKGLTAVYWEGGTLKFKDGLLLGETVQNDAYVDIFRDGNMVTLHTLAEIRERLEAAGKTYVL